MKPTAQRRRDRRALLDNLLGRMLRGRLTPAEAALLAETVREEQRAYDQTRRSLAETGTAYGHHRAAADAAIRETEQRAEQAETKLAQAEHQIGILLAVDEGRAHGAQRIMNERDQAQQRAEQAEKRAAAALDLADARGRALAARLDQHGAEQHRRNLAAILARPADTPFAELTEYAAKSLTRAGERLIAAEYRAEQAETRRDLAEGDVRTIREGVRACGGNPTEVQNVYAQLRMWRNRATKAEHRADRYRLAWMAARRDRKADRAAMAAERPAVEAVARVRAQCEDWSKQSPAFTYESRLRDKAVATVARIILDLLPPAPPAPDLAEPEPAEDAAPAPVECEVPHHRHNVIPPGPDCRRSK